MASYEKKITRLGRCEFSWLRTRARAKLRSRGSPAKGRGDQVRRKKKSSERPFRHAALDRSSQSLVSLWDVPLFPVGAALAPLRSAGLCVEFVVAQLLLISRAAKKFRYGVL